MSLAEQPPAEEPEPAKDGNESAAISDIVNAAIVDGGRSGRQLLAEAIDRAGLWGSLARASREAGMAPASLRIVIAPDLRAFAAGSPTATDPRLVEELIDLLHDRGYSSVLLAAARDSSALWAENRDVLALADLLGYRFETPEGRAYDMADLGEDLTPGEFPDGGLLHGSDIGSAWADAQYRIVFGKSRTDELTGYALCLDALIGLLPLPDKDYHYRHRFDAGDVALELLRAYPVGFALIDAVTGAHGSGGGRAPEAIATNTVIASRDLLLADYAGAAKMGLDPYSSPVNAKALRGIGLPPRFRIDGNLAPYVGWRNAHPLIIESTRAREQSVSASRTLKPWLQAVDRDLFPFTRPVDDKLNGFIAPYAARPDEDPVAFWGLVWGNYYLAALHRGVEAYRTLFDKDALRQREAPINIDLASLTLADYEAIVDELSPMAALVRDLPAQESGLRWRYLDEAILFEFTRRVPMPFEEFSACVDISRTIQFMNDYIGGMAVPVARDELGRVTHQAERNLYLPQPNYLVLYQGDVIDVTKIEHVVYGADEQRMFWKTVRSENDSARFDDGIVTFSRLGDETRVSICGRQLFTLPLFWQAVNLDLTPELKSHLVTDAYVTFFRRTMANLEAVAEGRSIRIGRPWRDGTTDPGTEPLPIDKVMERLERLQERIGQHRLGDLKHLLRADRAAPTPVTIDADGFRHFRAPDTQRADLKTERQAIPAGARLLAGEIADIWRDLAEALAKDAASPGGGGRGRL